MMDTVDTDLPATIATEAELDQLLIRPRPILVDFIKTLSSPLVVLGAGGKMGPTLAVLAQRAAAAAGHPLDIVAVSRFSDDYSRHWLETRGVRTLNADLLNRDCLKRLPDAAHVVYLVGLKFGTAQDPARTWATNTLAPANVAERFPHARIVALSTGNVYPLVPIEGGGSMETDPLMPLGEYANAAIARERIFEFFAAQNQTPLTLVRLNYAVELRYGVLVDIARKVLAGVPIDVGMGHLNCIWQGDANEMILRALSLASTPPQVINLTGPAILSVRELALRFGALLGRQPEIVGQEAATALLSNPARGCALLGPPATPLERVMAWTADWLKHGGRLLNKPTGFQTRDGGF